jgi:hypothetical protein
LSRGATGGNFPNDVEVDQNFGFGYGFGAETEEKLSFGVVSVTAVTPGWFRRFLVWDSPDLSALNADVFERYYLH